VKEILRARCPFCGMMPEAERILGSEALAELKIYLQRLGGKIAVTDSERAELERARHEYELERESRPSQKGRKRKFEIRARGLIEYEEIDDPELKRQILENLRKKAELLK